MSGQARAQRAYDNATPPDGMDRCSDCFRILDDHCEECGECDCQDEECLDEIDEEDEDE
jgi:hypothetical protein